MRGSSGLGCTRPAEHTRAWPNNSRRVRRNTQASLRVQKPVSGAVRTLSCTGSAALLATAGKQSPVKGCRTCGELSPQPHAQRSSPNSQFMSIPG